MVQTDPAVTITLSVLSAGVAILIFNGTLAPLIFICSRGYWCLLAVCLCLLLFAPFHFARQWYEIATCVQRLALTGRAHLWGKISPPLLADRIEKALDTKSFFFNFFVDAFTAIWPRYMNQARVGFQERWQRVKAEPRSIKKVIAVGHVVSWGLWYIGAGLSTYQAVEPIGRAAFKPEDYMLEWQRVKVDLGCKLTGLILFVVQLPSLFSARSDPNAPSAPKHAAMFLGTVSFAILGWSSLDAASTSLPWIADNSYFNLIGGSSIALLSLSILYMMNAIAQPSTPTSLPVWRRCIRPIWMKDPVPPQAHPMNTFAPTTAGPVQNPHQTVTAPPPLVRISPVRTPTHRTVDYPPAAACPRQNPGQVFGARAPWIPLKAATM